MHSDTPCLANDWHRNIIQPSCTKSLRLIHMCLHSSEHRVFIFTHSCERNWLKKLMRTWNIQERYLFTTGKSQFEKTTPEKYCSNP